MLRSLLTRFAVIIDLVCTITSFLVLPFYCIYISIVVVLMKKHMVIGSALIAASARNFNDKTIFLWCGFH